MKELKAWRTRIVSQTSPLIHNVIGGNFNKEEVSALLNSKSARSNAVSNIVKLLDANGYDRGGT